VFLPNILLEPVSPGNTSRKIPEHLLKQKHCTLTPHVKAADFAFPFFYPRMLRCCEQDVLQCSVKLPRKTGKHRNRFAEHVTGWEAANASPDRAGNGKKK
jgi:hypothetical protein